MSSSRYASLLRVLTNNPTSNISASGGEEDQLYLDYLCASSLQKLRLEPSVLEEEEKSVVGELTGLAYSEYDSFLATSNCGKEVRQLYADFEKHLEKLLQTSVPKFTQTAIEEFLRNGNQILEEKASFDVIMSQYPKIMELLEAPQLMDTFIRNGYYEDAMELQSHIQKLLIRHPEIKLLKRIAAEISGGTSLMLQQLTHLLRSSISFPLCIRVIGYLRKMEAFAEPELRLLFLQQRGSFLKRTLADIKSSDHSEHLKKYLEITRVHFFDIITQYKRIFSDSNTIYTSTTSRQSYLSDFPVTVSTQSILSSFVLNFLDEFMQEIEIHVPKLRDANIINSIYTQATFFGTSLSNIGIDFSHAISSVFESTVFGIFQDIINDGIQEFIDWTLVDGNQFHAKNQFSDELTAATSTTTTTTPVSSAGSNPNSLQLTLNRLQLYPSLAFILNKYYYAFNQIRILPSARLIDSSRNLVQESLITISTRISKIAKSVPESEMVDYREACRFFSELLVPIVVDGLVRIFSEAIQNSEQVIRSKIEIRRIIAPLESSKRLD